MSRRSWTNDQLITAVLRSFSYRQTLVKLCLKPTGGNYKQLQKYINDLELDISHFKGKTWNKGIKTGTNPRVPLEQILIKGSTFQSYKLKKRLFH